MHKYLTMPILSKDTEPQSSEELISLELAYGAHNYAPLPVVISHGMGVHVWDMEGRQYYDFLSAYSALNFGHCHPRLVSAMKDQISRLTLTSRAFHNNLLGPCEEMLCNQFGFDKALMMNSGAEAVETALKLARKWAYLNKGIADNKAMITVVANNFHGRTTGIISFSTDKSSREGFGPFMHGYYVVPYNDLSSLEEAFKNEHMCAFLLEPIQGEAGVILPDEGYLRGVRELCTKYNVLMIADEIQTGMGRTGKLLCLNYEEVQADILILGKALGGGMLPVSAVLCNDAIMLNIKPGEHGSTFGGNPLAARLCMESLAILNEEHLIDNSFELGIEFRARINKIQSPMIKEVRGKGLFNAIRLHNTELSGYDVCLALMKNGLLAKQTHGNIIRFAPPLVINGTQLDECCGIIEKTFNEL